MAEEVRVHIQVPMPKVEYAIRGVVIDNSAPQEDATPAAPEIDNTSKQEDNS